MQNLFFASDDLALVKRSRKLIMNADKVRLITGIMIMIECIIFMDFNLCLLPL